jgi:hypothetical protein
MRSSRRYPRNRFAYKLQSAKAQRMCLPALRLGKSVEVSGEVLLRSAHQSTALVIWSRGLDDALIF